MRKTGVILMAAVAALVMLMGCQPANQPDTPSDPVVRNLTWNYVSGEKPYTTVSFAGEDQVNVTVTGDVGGKDLFLVKGNKSLEGVSAAQAGGAQRSGGDNMEMSRWADKDDSLEPEGRVPFVPREKLSMEFIQGVQEAESTDPEMVSRSSLGGEPAASSEYGDTSGFSAGDTRDFHLTNDNGDTWYTKTATLKAVGYYTYIWVDNDYFDDSSTDDDDNRITQDQVDSLMDAYDGTDDEASADGIYEWVSHLFGYETGGGSTTGDGGVDEDKRVSILITDIDEDGTPSGGVYGFYWSKDQYLQSDLDNWGYNVQSNEMEMFYVDTHFADSNPEGIKSTLAHEYQHMIHFQRKNRENGLNSPTWYNEMMSMACEDLVQDKLDLTDAQSPKNRAYRFNEWYYRAGVAEWGVAPEIYDHYAVDYIFGAFLMRWGGGAPLAAEILRNNAAGIESVNQALTAVDSNFDDFNEAFEGFAASLALPEMTGGFPSGATWETAAYDGVEYTLSAFDLYDTDYQVHSYEGPGMYYPDEEIPLGAYGVSFHANDPWFDLSAGDEVDVTIDQVPASSVQYYLVLR